MGLHWPLISVEGNWLFGYLAIIERNQIIDIRDAYILVKRDETMDQ